MISAQSFKRRSHYLLEYDAESPTRGLSPVPPCLDLGWRELSLISSRQRLLGCRESGVRGGDVENYLHSLCPQ